MSLDSNRLETQVNHVQALMQSNPYNWAEILEGTYKIKITRDGYLASLKYDQLESPMHEPIVQQCRGMVVDTERLQVVAWPYDKFWNHGDVGAASIDWSTARTQEKLDGSLMILHWDERGGAWSVASSGTPRASGSFGADKSTFREAFWQTFAALGYQLPKVENWDDTAFMFELCDTPNRVVVQHATPRLVLHGARTLGGRELGGTYELSDEARANGWELVREFPIASIHDCLHAAEALDPIQQEGFVVVDAAFNRIKIKSPRYVILHHMKGEATVRRAVELWQTGEATELLLHFPEMAGVIIPVHDELDRIAAQAVADFAENSARTSRKAFALAVKDRPWSTVLFRMLTDGSTLDIAKAIMRRQSTAALERLVTP